MSDYNKCRREGKIVCGDDFSSFAEITSLFGVKEPKSRRVNSFLLPGVDDTLCCVLSENGDDGWSYALELGEECDGCGWREVLSVAEANSDARTAEKRMDDELKRPLTRLVFWKMTRQGASWYKFLGAFKFDQKWRYGYWERMGMSCVYGRISTSVECPKADWRVTSVGREKLEKMTGTVLMCELLDSVMSSSPDGKRKECRIWPGTTLLVTKVNDVRQELYCEVKGSDEVYVIPKRDLELGYFRVALEDGKIGDTGMPENPSPDVWPVCRGPSQRELVLRQLDRKVERIRETLSRKGSPAAKRIVRKIMRENEDTLWSWVMKDEDIASIDADQIPVGYIEAHAIKGYVGGYGPGVYALFDRDGNFVKLV